MKYFTHKNFMKTNITMCGRNGLFLDNLEIVADMDLANLVCGQFGICCGRYSPACGRFSLWPIWTSPGLTSWLHLQYNLADYSIYLLGKSYVPSRWVR
jgi:hypothetical protein